jgi:hypothetical protein
MKLHLNRASDVEISGAKTAYDAKVYILFWGQNEKPLAAGTNTVTLRIKHTYLLYKNRSI